MKTLTTGDGILKTGTDTITVHTASDHHGGGADITARSTVHTAVHTGVHGITTLAECTDTMILGTTETHGTTADTTETTTQDTGEDITEAGTAGMILGTITTTVGITLTTYTALHT